MGAIQAQRSDKTLKLAKEVKESFLEEVVLELKKFFS